MELRELMEILPRRSNVRIYVNAHAPIRTTAERFIDTSDDLVLEYGHCDVQAVEFNIANMSYDVCAKQVARNIDKLQEIFPYAEFNEGLLNPEVLNFNIDNRTPFHKKWLYAPYNEEEGKEE